MANEEANPDFFSTFEKSIVSVCDGTGRGESDEMVLLLLLFLKIYYFKAGITHLLRDYK